VIVYSFAFALFSSEGLVSQLLFALGDKNARVDILTNNGAAWFFQTALSVWKSLGYTAIIYFAAISAIDLEQYDAAKVDGANRLQTVLHVTLPGIASTYVVILILTISNLLNNGFDQYFMFYNGLVADKIQVLDLYIYTVGLRTNDVPFATAIGVYKTFLSMVLLFSGNIVAKKIRGEGIL
jgi:ABC-type polysaccharide transport system permease subunit